MNGRLHMMGTLQKVQFAMTSRSSTTAISFVAFLGFSSALCAQQAKVPTLEEILQRLEANLNHYDTGVPSLFCDEHVNSQVEPGPRDQDTITDSIFRLKRTATANHTTTLVESREIKNVNGKPATSQDMDGPTMLSGAFEGGLAVVSLSQTACMNYALQRINKNRPTEPYIVRFATVLTPQNIANCLLQEDSKGRAFIDPASMQITHLELTTPRHVLTPRTHIDRSSASGASGSSPSTTRLFCSAVGPSGCPPQSPCVSQEVPEPFTRPCGRSGLPIATTTSWKSHRASLLAARYQRDDSAQALLTMTLHVLRARTNRDRTT